MLVSRIHTTIEDCSSILIRAFSIVGRSSRRKPNVMTAFLGLSGVFGEEEDYVIVVDGWRLSQENTTEVDAVGNGFP